MKEKTENHDKLMVWLDDERDLPSLEWTGVKTAPDCIMVLKMFQAARQTVDVISLDHDLGDAPGVGTGYEVLCWIEEQIHTNPEFVPPKEIRIHTANPSARKKMTIGVASIARTRSNQAAGEKGRD
jgi:hypothetical protein